jgi:mannitol/fructose-specific phosphotransferase system IIA component (Ntr-type)
MTFAIIFLDIELLVKTASTLGIILFMLVNLSVIFMRESSITSYKPKFRSPLYPYIQILAIVVYAVLLAGMGLIPLAISAGFVILSTACYFFYSSPHVSRGSAAMHIVERITDRQIQTVTLENELRDILIERDEIVEDRFDILVRECPVFDLKGQKEFQPTIHMLAEILESRLDTNQYVLVEKFIEREATGGTVVQPGLAIPHVIVDGTEKFDLAIVRAADGIKFPHAEEPVKIMFVLAGSKDERNFHLRALMAIAQITQEKDFEKRWFQARDEQALRNILLLSQRKRETL